MWTLNHKSINLLDREIAAEFDVLLKINDLRRPHAISREISSYFWKSTKTVKWRPNVETRKAQNGEQKFSYTPCLDEPLQQGRSHYAFLKDSAENLSNPPLLCLREASFQTLTLFPFLDNEQTSARAYLFRGTRGLRKTSTTVYLCSARQVTN